jgi:hypothetical protein
MLTLSLARSHFVRFYNDLLGCYTLYSLCQSGPIEQSIHSFTTFRVSELSKKFIFLPDPNHVDFPALTLYPLGSLFDLDMP